MHIEDGNKDYVDTDVINFEKVLLMGSLLNQICTYQKSDYTKRLEGRDSSLLKFLSCLQYYDEPKLEQLSLAQVPLPEGSESLGTDVSVKEEEEEEERDQGSGEETDEEFSVSASFDELPEERQDSYVYETYFPEK